MYIVYIYIYIEREREINPEGWHSRVIDVGFFSCAASRRVHWP